MKWIALAFIGVAVLCGCGKKDTTPAGTTPGKVASSQKPLEGALEPVLTAALKSFVQEKGRLPQSMFELKNAKFDSIPRAPAGFIYAIDPATVEVKVVKQ